MAKYDLKLKKIYDEAYALMDVPVISGNCGERCGFHCCRPYDENGDRFGMYLLPLEFEYMQCDTPADYEIHSAEFYDLPPRIKKRYYMYCHEEKGCLRELRPIQCRTYPFEPHLDKGELILVIEKTQIHECPLLNEYKQWQPSFIDGIYKGWELLLQIPLVRYWIQYVSDERSKNNNIKLTFHPHRGWF